MLEISILEKLNLYANSEIDNTPCITCHKHQNFQNMKFNFQTPKKVCQGYQISIWAGEKYLNNHIFFTPNIEKLCGTNRFLQLQPLDLSVPLEKCVDVRRTLPGDKVCKSSGEAGPRQGQV